MDTVLLEGHSRAGLSGFTEAVDPLLAASAHNKEFSLLLKLPDEILLAILQILQSDLRNIYYVRRVCRKLRSLSEDRFLDPRLFWDRGNSRGSHMLHQDRFISRENSRMPFGPLTRDLVPGFEAVIRKQTLCKPCQIAHRNRSLRNQCAFVETPTYYIPCAGCDSYHPRNAFSHTQRRLNGNYRICIGREGRLRLCEHMSINWADIEAHLAAASRTYNFYKAVSDFHIVCKHPSHNFTCKSTSRQDLLESSCNDHTRPCARLQIDPHSRHLHRTPVSLVLCWKPHSSSKVLTAPENGEIEATRLRELYGEYAKKAARFIVPGPNRTPIPEMLCFDPEKCRHIFYRNGVRPQATHYEQASTLRESCEKENGIRTETALDRDHQDESRYTGLGWPDHYVEFNESRGQSGIYVYECGEEHNGQDSNRCLMISYRRAISLGYIDHRRLGALNPSHEWFHAIDQDSFPEIRQERGLWSKVEAYIYRTKSRPRCRDASGSCRNYYQSPGPLHDDSLYLIGPLGRTGCATCDELLRCAVGVLWTVTLSAAFAGGLLLHYLW